MFAIHIKQFRALCIALVSASAIIGSTIIMPINVLADAGTTAEQPVDASIQSCELECVDPLVPAPSSEIEQLDTTNQPQNTDPVTPSPSEEVVADTSSTTTALESDTTIATDAQQAATSGDISATSNEEVGNATTGQADGTVLIENEANTVTTIGDGSSGTLGLDASQDGDLVISPQLASSGGQSALPVTLTEALAVDNDTTISNIVVVDSQSGGATLIGNEEVGDVRTGDALSDVAILNMANHIITSGDVFVGSITVQGDLNNDIVLSEALIAYLLQGTAPLKTIASSTVDINNLQVIDNHVNALAESGAIELTDNEEVGNVRTGNAETIVLIKNMAGSFVLYGRSLLIVVNVFGDWNGGVMGQPATAVTAISATPTGNSATALAMSTPNGAYAESVAISNTTTITNNVTATARSGSVTAQYNEELGDITTGNATVRVRIMNIANTIVSFSDWLGVLFINVFGNWTGGVVMQQSAPTDGGTEEQPTVISTPPPANPVLAPIVGLQALFRAFRSSPPVAAASTEAETTVAGTEDTNATPIFFVTENAQQESSNSLAWILLVLLITGGLLSGNRIFAIRHGGGM